MSRIDDLKDRYSRLDTDALLEMWVKEERMDWAEAVLREELLSRDVAAARLDGLAGSRAEIAANAPPLVRDTVVAYGILGRAGAFFIAIAVSNIGRALVGPRVAMAGVIVVLGIYVAILLRRVVIQFRTPVGGWGGFLMVWQCVEASLILVGFSTFWVADLMRGS